MDKIKSLLSGGSHKEDEPTYDQDSYSQNASHPGKLTGEGSHLTSATGNTGTTSTGPAPTTTGPHSSDIMNKADPRIDSNPSHGTATGTGTDTGTGSDFAQKAASTAWSSPNQSAPGAFPQEDTSNPYAASSIDPRVDKVPRAHDTSVGTGLTTSTADTSIGQSTGTGLGQSTDSPSGLSEYGNTGRTGPSSSFNEHSGASQVPGASSRLTGGSEYSNTAGAGGYDNTTSQSSVPPSSTSNITGTTNNQSTVGKALGAIGLGGAAARADTQTPSTSTGTGSYDTPAQGGEIPSHHRKESIPTTAYPSGTLDSPRAVAPPVGAPASGNSTAIADEPSSGDATGRAAIGQTSTYGSHYLGAGEPTSSIVDPSSSDPNTFRKPETSHLGRDVGIGGGVGAAGVGAASAYGGSRDPQGVGSGLQSGAPTTSTSGEHTSFYDAATVGHQPGTGSSGVGSTGPSQEYSTSSSGVPATGLSQGYGTTPDRHPGRDAAEVGAGAGALGAGAYEYEKHRGPQDTTGPSSGYGSTTGNTTSNPGYQTTPSTTGYQTTQSNTGHQTTPATTGYQTASQEYDQTGDRHLGRDAAVVGAGAGAAGVGAHEHSKHEAKEAEKEHSAHDKAIAREERHEEKKLEKSEKQQEKHREKEIAKEERVHEPHSHRKEEVAAAGAVGAGAVGAHEYDEHDQEKKPSLMQRILHPKSSKAAAHEETSGLAASDAADNRAFHEHGDAGSQRTSSITPAGYAEAPTKGYASQVTGGTGTTALAQGEGLPMGSHATALGNVLESRDPTVRDGSAPNLPTERGQATAGTEYAEAPSSGYASQMTGSSGTTGLGTGGAAEPANPSSAGGGALSGHQHGLQGSGLTRESMTGQPGTGHQFGEITDHNR